MKKRVPQKIKGIIENLCTLSGNVSGICILVIAISVVYEVIMRSFFNKPSSWTLELSIHLTIAATFLGAPYVAQEGKNVVIDILTLQLPKKTKNYLDFAVHLISLPFLFLFGYSIYKLMETSRQAHIVTPALEIPLHIPQSVLLIGLILLILQLGKITVEKGMELIKEKSHYEISDGESNAAGHENTMQKSPIFHYGSPAVILSIFFGLILLGGFFTLCR